MTRLLLHSRPSERRRRWRHRSSSRPVIALDVGSSSVRIGLPKARVLEEPSVVAVADGRTVAAGWRALMVEGSSGQEPVLVHPVCGGAPVDRPLFEELLRGLLVRAGAPVERPGPLVVSSPLWMGEEEASALSDTIRSVIPTDDITFVTAPVAAALGAASGLLDDEPKLVVDIGHHLTEAAVVAGAVPLAASSAWTGGADARGALAAHLAETTGLEIGRRSSSRAIRLASHPKYGEVPVRGVDLSTGRSRAVLLHSDEIAEILTPVISDVTAVVQEVVDATTDTVGAAAKQRGVLLTGGMAGVHGVREGLAAGLDAPVVIANAPTRTVVQGLRASTRTGDVPNRHHRDAYR